MRCRTALHSRLLYGVKAEVKSRRDSSYKPPCPWCEPNNARIALPGLLQQDKGVWDLLILSVMTSRISYEALKPRFACIHIRAQEGTIAQDYLRSATATSDGAIVLAGYTYGDWNGTNAGDSAFFALKLSSDDGSVLWRWQVG